MSADRCVPGKRLRNWYRRARRATALSASQSSLKRFARHMALQRNTPEAGVAQRWLAGKGVRA